MTSPNELYRVSKDLFVRHLNAYETDFLYHEIFEQGAYLKHGIKVDGNSVVFDVGANIGLFTLFLKRRFPGIRIQAFEPIPAAFECLAYNTSAFGGSVRIFNVGISDSSGNADFIYYPGYSVISGFHADKKKDAAVISNGMKSGMSANGEQIDEAKLDSLIAGRFRKKIVLQCKTITISQAMKQSQLTHLDLLKIDAERSERAILSGIKDEDWPRIRQIVLEAHDERQLSEMRSLLEGKGFNVRIEIETALAASGIHNVYAIRR